MNGQTASRSRRALPGVIGAGLVLLALAAGLWRTEGDGDRGGGDGVAADTGDGGDGGDGAIVAEGERAAYVARFCALERVEVSRDVRPDDAGPVPGLLRVTGVLLNRGDRAVRSVQVVILPEDSSGKVIGMFREDVLRGARLGPGASRAFDFTLPERREFSGRFQSEVR